MTSCAVYENCATQRLVEVKTERDVLDFLFVGCWGVYCDQGEYTLFKSKKEGVEQTRIYRGQREVAAAIQEYVSKIPTISDMFLAGDNVYQVALEERKEGSETQNEARKKNFLSKLGVSFTNAELYDIKLQLSKGFEQCFALTGISRFFVALGNHDIENCEILNTQVNYSGSGWTLPSLYYNVMYTLRDGTTLNIVVMDTNPYDSEAVSCTGQPFLEKDVEKQEEWLRKQKKRAEWTIVIGHIPYRAVGHKAKKPEISNPKLERAVNLVSPQLYMCADEHNQQFLYDSKNSRGLVVAGSGGTDLDTPENTQAMYVKKTFGFVHTSLSKKGLVLKFLDTGPEVLYTVRIGKDGKLAELTE